MGLTEEQLALIREKIREGKKIEAIKQYREFTNLGLKEAKDAVEALEAGKEIFAAGASTEGLPAEEIEREVRRVLWQGKKIEAITRYRQMTGAGLKDSKDAVDRIEAAYRAESPEYAQNPARSGCMGMLILAAGLAGALAAFATN